MNERRESDIDLYVNYLINEEAKTLNLFNNSFSGNSDFITGLSDGLFVAGTDKYSQGSNIQVDPLFVASTNRDFHLQPSSFLINMGENNAPALPLTDFDGDTRIINGTVDIGADEVGGFSISGHIKSKGHPLSGVTVNLTGDKTDTTTTDINGYYYFRIENGEYVLTASKENCYFGNKPKKAKVKEKSKKVNFKGKLTLASTN